MQGYGPHGMNLPVPRQVSSSAPREAASCYISYIPFLLPASKDMAARLERMRQDMCFFINNSKSGGPAVSAKRKKNHMPLPHSV
ncbi:MAG TPA: hypothetical protein DDX59_02355 [Lachnospiraceae bacterium]|jgi:hypothetical protein|nr:hypothetical protein [Lachnospiraceae bacterium]